MDYNEAQALVSDRTAISNETLLVSQLRETLGKMEIALGTINDSIVWTNESGIIEWCNSSFDKLTKKNHLTILGASIFNILPLERNEKQIPFNLHPLNLVLNSANSLTDIYDFNQEEKKLIFEISTTQANFNNKNKCIVFSIHNITERKHAEESLKKTYKELEIANNELNDFAYIVSHDLKAPLRAISSLASFLETDYLDKLEQNGKEQLNLLVSRTKRMHDLIDGILRYSRVTRTSEQKNEVDLDKLVKEIAESILPTKKNIKLTIKSKLPKAVCEPTQIEQVFQNLISNAAKFIDKPNGEIKIDCVDENTFWKLSVCDNGPGIEEKYYEKIFQIFQTLHSRDEFESTGVGLSIVKKIIEKWGGKIWIYSKVGGGSTFYFTLPKSKSRLLPTAFISNIT